MESKEGCRRKMLKTLQLNIGFDHYTSEMTNFKSVMGSADKCRTQENIRYIYIFSLKSQLLIFNAGKLKSSEIKPFWKLAESGQYTFIY